jgi:hypothetical protein
MKRLLIIFMIYLVGIVSLQAQYSASFHYGNIDWIPKNNKVLTYENTFFLQSFNFGGTGISLWQASCITKSPNNYELGGVDYVVKFGKIKPRVGFHGSFPKETFTKYIDKGNFVPNIGVSYIPDSTQCLTTNVFQYWDYGFASQFFVSNLVYKKTFKFGAVEMGQYFNFKIDALSGSIAYSKSWQVYKKFSGFASIRWSFNESRVKQNDGKYIIVNVGIKI